MAAKYSARVGLLLSSTRYVEFIKDTNWKIEKDITRNGFHFTDGCGRMSVHMARRFVQGLKLKKKYQEMV